MASSSDRASYDALMKKKIIVLKTKIKALEKFDVWLALSLTSSNISKIPSILVILGYEVSEFETIVNYGSMWPGYGLEKRVKWGVFFKKYYGISTTTIRNHWPLVCVNFHPEATGCPNDVINGGGQRLMFLTRQIRAATTEMLVDFETSCDVISHMDANVVDSAVKNQDEAYNATASMSLRIHERDANLEEAKGAMEFMPSTIERDAILKEAKGAMESLLRQIEHRAILKEIKGAMEFLICTIVEDAKETDHETMIVEKKESAASVAQHLNITDIKDRISKGGCMTEKEKIDLSDLLSFMARDSGPFEPSYFEINIGGSHGNRGVLLMPSRKPRPETKDTSHHTVNLRAKTLTLVMEKTRVGPRSIAKVMDMDELTDLFDAAIQKSKRLPRKQTGSVDFTLQQMRAQKMTWTGFRNHKKICHAGNVPCHLASENALRKIADEAQVRHNYYETTLMNATGVVDALVYVADAADVVASELDRIVKFNMQVNWNLERDGDVPVVHLKIAEDKGDNASKVIATVVDQPDPCSPFNAGILATWEGRHYDQKDKPSDCYENMAAIFPLIPSLYDLHGSVVVRVGHCHVLVPRHSVHFQQELLTKKLTNEEDEAAFIAKQEYIAMDASRSAHYRRTCPNGSAILVISKSNLCIGVQAGEFCIGLRTPQANYETQMSILDVFYSADLMSLSDVVGMPNMSNHTSLWIRLAADAFKLLVRGILRSWELRTTESQQEDLNAYESRKTKGKYAHVNGVSKKSLLMCPYSNVVTPPLHLTLGPSNLQKDKLNEDLAVLDCKNVALVQAEAALSSKICEVRLRLTQLTNRVCQILGGFAPESMDQLYSVLTQHISNIDLEILRLGEAMASRSALDIEEMREASRIKEIELEFLKGSWNGIVDSSFELNSLMTKLEETKQSQSAWEEAHPKKKAKTKRKGDAKTHDAQVDETRGTLQKKFNDVLLKHKVATQEYWNNTMVGRACRTFLEKREEILKDTCECIVDAGHGRDEADDFYKRHIEVLTPLSVAARHMRRVAVLSPTEKSELKAACAEYGRAFRRNFPDCLLTPKQNTLEMIVPLQIDMFSSLGIFSEENVESIHPLYTEVMGLVKTVRNPTKRHQAGLTHFNLRRLARPPPPAKKRISPEAN